MFAPANAVVHFKAEDFVPDIFLDPGNFASTVKHEVLNALKVH